MKGHIFLDLIKHFYCGKDIFKCSETGCNDDDENDNDGIMI